MRTVLGRCVLCMAITVGIVTMGAATSAEAARPVKEVAKKVVRPSKAARAKAPPKGSKISKALAFNKTMKWKTDAKSHSVFALGPNKQLWFLDPGTGWPYTIDARGNIYTADPLSGIVYDLGRLSTWAGDALYFFDYWDFSNGGYTVPSMDVYVTIYDNPTAEVYSYETAYTEVWEYDEYFESEEFVNETVDVEYYEDDGHDEADAANAELDAASHEADAAEHEADAAEHEADAAENAANAAADEAEADAAEHEADAAADEADAAEDAANDARDEADDAEDDASDAQDDAVDAQDEADDAQDEADDAQDEADDAQDDAAAAEETDDR